MVVGTRTRDSVLKVPVLSVPFPNTALLWDLELSSQVIPRYLMMGSSNTVPRVVITIAVDNSYQPYLILI
jgi:hypothetical protein